MMAIYRNNKLLLVDLQCLPSINYYKLLVNYEKLKFEQYEHFRKGSYSNRFYIAGANGRILLSIPLLHARRGKMPLKDLKISYLDKWQLIHWRTLTSAYHRSPWFEFYEEELHSLYENKFEYLLDWNLQAFNLVNKWLGFSWQVSLTDEYFSSYTNPELKDVRNLILPKNTLGNAEANFQQYHQVFEDHIGFLPGLSILDLLFCEGKNAGELLSQWSSSV
ncbi:MAG: WbqC family protein [Chitinophagaceae bacterium]